VFFSVSFEIALCSTGIVPLSTDFILAQKEHDGMFIHYGFVPNVVGQGVALLVSVWELLKANIFPQYGHCDQFFLSFSIGLGI
jgi:hypothetical protein